MQYLYVAPAFRRAGVASTLLRHLAQWFVEQGATRVCVDVNEESPGAAPFYKSHGAVPRTLVLVADAYARWQLTRNRVPKALAGRVADWAEQDYESALLQVAVLHAGGQREAWATALRRARRLAGEREISAELLTPPS